MSVKSTLLVLSLLVIALGSASLFLVTCAIGLKASAAERPVTAPLVDKDIGTPVKVIPVLDMDVPLLKLGGTPDSKKLPDRWVKKSAKARVEQKAQILSQSSLTVLGIANQQPGQVLSLLRG